LEEEGMTKAPPIPYIVKKSEKNLKSSYLGVPIKAGGWR